MAEPTDLCLIRGGGDLATGVAWRLSKAGFRVVATELAEPMTVRRTVAVSSAVRNGAVSIEGMRAERVDDEAGALHVAANGAVAVLVSPDLPKLDQIAVIDARLAKRNIDTSIDDASVVVGLGPGFTAGVDCHAVIETNRGPHLGRVLWKGSAEPDTGTPGLVAGRTAERVVRAPADGAVRWEVQIGDVVSEGAVLGSIDGHLMTAAFTGVVRGLIGDGIAVHARQKVGDIDPRLDVPCNEISDKALAIGGGVVEAVLSGLRR